MNRFSNIPDKPVIALVRPAISRWRLYRYYAPFGSREPSYGLLYIASYLHKKGYETYILDGEVLGDNGLLEKIKNVKPDLIGITSATFSFNYAKELAIKFRYLFPRSLIVLGGAHVSALPLDSIEKISQIDGVVFGEGEETMLEIVQKKETFQIDGLVWRSDTNEIPISNRSRSIAQDLDKYSLNWNLLEGFPEKYAPPFQTKTKNSASLVVSRGCYYDCSFCSSSQIHGKKIRIHSPEFVVRLLEELNVKYNIRDFYFHDDYLPVYPDWMRIFCMNLINKKKQFTWSCASRVETLSEEILYLMKNSGCRQIAVGIESGSQKVLDRLAKRIKIDKMREGLNRIKDACIDIKALFILDTPDETFSDNLRTLKLILSNNFSHVQFNFYNPLPGSKDYELYSGHAKNWDKMNFRWSLGYSKISSWLFPFIELIFYLTAYSNRMLKIIYSKILKSSFRNISFKKSLQ